MICPHCNNDNNGIRLNGKLYCVSCGEIMKDVIENLEYSYKIHGTQSKRNIYEPRRFSKDSVDITPQNNTKENINLLKAEEEILESIEEIATKKVDSKIKKLDNNVATNHKIIKKNRERINIKPPSDYSLIYGEPDPINEPELPPPHDMQVEEHKNIDFNKEINYPLHTRQEQTKIHENVRKKQKALTNFFKEASNNIPTRGKGRRRTNRKTKISLLIIALIVTLIAGAIGMFFYVNNVATNPKIITDKIESKTDFTFKKPEYIPPGYEISYKSYAYGNEIHYYYEYLPDTNNVIIISISETDVASDNFLESTIIPMGQKYYKYPLDNLSIWFVGNNKAIFINKNLIYEIFTTNEINTRETIKIIKGLI